MKRRKDKKGELVHTLYQINLKDKKGEFDHDKF